jgi:hypothetical protein
MAGRVLSRRALRDQHDASEEADVEADDTEADDEAPAKPAAKKTRAKKAAAKSTAAKAPAKPRVRKKTVKEPPRMFARWAVCDNGMKRVAVFGYKDRAGADARLAELRERKTGTFCLQLVKDPYDPAVDPAPVVAPAPAV